MRAKIEFLASISLTSISFLGGPWTSSALAQSLEADQEIDQEVASGQSVEADAPWAQTTASSGQEIVVTAQRRPEALWETPLAVSALSGDQLQDRNYNSIQDLSASIANVTVSDYGGSFGVSIRGIGRPNNGPSAEPATGAYLNGVFLSRPFEVGAAFLDLERVEVLRGPQGTLYGRNSTGGLINFITAKPSREVEGYGRLSFGNYDSIRTEAVVSGPIAGERLLGRLAIGTEDRDGYSLNLFDNRRYDNQHAQTVRGTLLFEPTDLLSFTLVGDYHRESDRNYATHFLGVGIPGALPTGVAFGGQTVPLDEVGNAIDPRLLNIDSEARNRRQYGGLSLDIALELNSNLSLKTISAYRRAKYSFTADFDATTKSFPSNNPEFNYVQGESVTQFSQEIQLLGEYDRFNFIGGLYYLNQKLDPAFFDFGFTPEEFPFGLLAGGRAGTDAYAAFGQGTYQLTDRLGLTVGLRYSYEERRVDENWTSGGVQLVGAFLEPCASLPGFVCAQKADANFDAFTPRFGVDFQITDNLFLYSSVSRGFRSGGFSVSDLKPAFEPETVWAYESGIRWKAFDNRVRISASAFHYDYSNLQIQQVIDGYVSTINAATSKVDGAEVELLLTPLEGLTISNAFAYLDARFTEFTITDPTFPELGAQDLSGNTLPFSPEFSNNLTLSYDVPVGDFFVRLLGEWTWRDETFFSEFNLLNASQPSVSIYNASVKITGKNDRWFVDVWGKNLADKTVISQNFISSTTLGRPRNGQLAPPRTYGVTVGYSF